MVETEIGRETRVAEAEWTVESEETISIGADRYIAIRLIAIPTPEALKQPILSSLKGSEYASGSKGELHYWRQVASSWNEALGVSVRPEALPPLPLTFGRLGRYVKWRGSISANCASFVERNLGQLDVPFITHDLLMPALIDLPIPVFGSPPKQWKKLAMFGSVNSAVLVPGTIEHHPVLVAATLSTTALIYMVAPSARVVRRGMAEKIARKMNTVYREADEE